MGKDTGAMAGLGQEESARVASCTGQCPGRREGGGMKAEAPWTVLAPWDRTGQWNAPTPWDRTGQLLDCKHALFFRTRGAGN